MQRYLRLIISLIFILLPITTYAAMKDLTSIQIITTDTVTRVIFSLSAPTHPHVSVLKNSDKVIFDFDHVHLAESLQNLKLPTKDIQSIQAETPKADSLRLILKLTANSDVSIMPTGQSDRFVLDIERGKMVPNKPSPVSISSKVMTKKVAALEKVMTSRNTEQAPVKAIAETIKPDKHHITTIVIDAGHGGKDPGALGSQGAKEKDVVLAIAKRLAVLINQQPGMHAELTRDGDYFVPLRDRLKLARKGKADLFMSIHADSYFNTQARGTSVYTLSHHGATSEAARWLSKRENYSELGGVDLGELDDQSVLLRSVLINLSQTATITDSLHLGSFMLDALNHVSKLRYSRVEQAPFMVLKSPDIPSILVETGFISNTNEERQLSDASYQNKLAQALFDGARAYIKKQSNQG